MVVYFQEASSIVVLNINDNLVIGFYHGIGLMDSKNSKLPRETHCLITHKNKFYLFAMRRKYKSQIRPKFLKHYRIHS